ncbi:MAG: RNA polymerase sigma factor [Pirellulaceae bacterium]|nr:RNA polymerase sigma factor [Pirellulaceae bacterium]
MSADEGQWIEKAKAGDRESFRAIYEAFGPRAMHVAKRIVGEFDAADVVQDAFVKLFSKLLTFRGNSNFSTWIHRFMVNEALQHLRRRNRPVANGRSFLDTDGLQAEDSQPLEVAESVEKAMAAIDPELRTIFELKELDEMSYSQIAEVIGIPEGTVGSRLNRARRELKEQLQRLGWE